MSLDNHYNSFFRNLRNMSLEYFLQNHSTTAYFFDAPVWRNWLYYPTGSTLPNFDRCFIKRVHSFCYSLANFLQLFLMCTMGWSIFWSSASFFKHFLNVQGVPCLCNFWVPRKPHYWQNRTWFSTIMMILDIWIFKVRIFSLLSKNFTRNTFLTKKYFFL